jgi:hypothetical protein
MSEKSITRNDIYNETLDLHECDDYSVDSEVFYFQKEYDNMKELFELTKVSHNEMCERVIKLQKYYKSLEQLQKELKITLKHYNITEGLIDSVFIQCLNGFKKVKK